MTKRSRRTLTAALMLFAVGACLPAMAQDTDTKQDPLRLYTPSSISLEAAAIYRMYRPLLLLPQPIPQSNADFEALYRREEDRNIKTSQDIVRQLGATAAELQVNGVSVIEVRPKNWRDDGTVILDIHGGGFILGSAKSNLGGSARLADSTGKRVISIDYMVAPRGNWRIVTDQVVSVYKGVLATGVKASDIGIIGGSAGGTIATSSILKLRDEGLPLPAALMLISPMTDLTEGGDTRRTLGEADPVLRPDQVRPGLNAYAAPEDQKNPYVSPVYGDFSEGFPPVLIQGGTKEWLLSDFVRLHRAIKAAGGESALEIYEGMPHGFPVLMPNTPEGRQAAGEQLAFWKQRLPGKPSKK